MTRNIDMIITAHALASFIAAWHASRVDPLVALRVSQLGELFHLIGNRMTPTGVRKLNVGVSLLCGRQRASKFQALHF